MYSCPAVHRIALTTCLTRDLSLAIMMLFLSRAWIMATADLRGRRPISEFRKFRESELLSGLHTFRSQHFL